MGMTSCPNTTAAGCACPEHALGLAAYSPDPVAYEAALKPLRAPVTLRIVTTGPPHQQPCNGTMTCPCPACVQDRVTRTPAPAMLQPWVPKPARERRAA